MPRRPDPIKLARAKELRRQMTPAEQRLWDVLRTNQMAGLHFRRQHPISGFIADFYCGAAKLVVEVDGAVHDERPEYDAERDQVLTALGLRVLRFSNDEVLSNMEAVVERIRSAAGS
jgi:very-short-patch-repair endonuclease